MRNVYILHGCCDKDEFENLSIPSGSNFHWIPWLQKQLIVRDYNCQTPEMPTPYKASFASWKAIFESYPLDEGTILIAHSCGCGFFLRFLSENPQKIKKLVLVAPWLDPYRKLGSFLKFDLLEGLENYVEEMHVFYSKDEPVTGVPESVDLIKNAYPRAQLHKFETHGHFCLDDMGTEVFPELLAVVDA